MRNGELTVTIQPEDNSSDEFLIRIPAMILKMAGMRPGGKVVVSVEPCSWDSSDNPIDWHLEVSKAKEE